MISLVTIVTTDDGISCFGSKNLDVNERNGMFLTDQIGAKNFRIRESIAGYKTNWHMAGDPTLIVILQGCLRIILQNGEYKDFVAGDMFVAEDNLPMGILFDEKIHGHKAEVMGEEGLRAVHIKLN